MGQTNKITQYHHKQNDSADVVRKEFQEIERQRDQAKRKQKKWKCRYARQGAKLKKTRERLTETQKALVEERKALAKEQKDAKHERVMLQIQTRLDDWAFLYGNPGGEENQ